MQLLVDSADTFLYSLKCCSRYHNAKYVTGNTSAIFSISIIEIFFKIFLFEFPIFFLALLCLRVGSDSITLWERLPESA